METLSGSLTVFSRTDALILYIPLVTTNLDIMNDYRIINFKCIILYLDYMITYGISWDIFHKKGMNMKTFRIFVVMMAICVLMTGCGKQTNSSTSTAPSGNTAAIDDTSDTQNTTSQDVNSTTEAPSQETAHSGGDYVSSDSRITPVSIADYWISDTQFDFINYCKNQGATVKYMLENEDGSIYYCSPEELASAGKTPLAIGGFFNFGGDPEFVSVDGRHIRRERERICSVFVIIDLISVVAGRTG